MAPLTSFIENFCLNVYLKNWLRYRYSKFQFCLLPSAIDILATVTTFGTFKHLDISNVPCKCQRNRPSSFWDTALLSLYRYRYSKFEYCLLPSAIDILATVTTLGTFKDLDVSNVSCKFQRNRPSSFWDTALLSLYYLPKLHFGKYVTQSVCLYVCLFVCLCRCFTISRGRVTKSSPHLVHI